MAALKLAKRAANPLTHGDRAAEIGVMSAAVRLIAARLALVYVTKLDHDA